MDLTAALTNIQHAKTMSGVQIRVARKSMEAQQLQGAAIVRLIEAAGAKGWREGGAEVSPLHANFIVNTGGASARDVATLLARVRRAVEEKFGVDLHLEVHLVGEFTDTECPV